MAREEIKLVGSFDDQITKKLQKLNKEIANMSRSFERFNKKLAPVTKSFAKMAMSAQGFSNAMKTQRTSIDSSTRAMREYSRQAGKMSGALRKVTDQRMKAQRAMGVSRTQARKGGGGGGSPMSGGGAGAGVAYGASAAKGFNSGIGSIAIGSAIGGMASQAIMRGMSGLSNMIQAPFKKFSAAFGERIGDEMDDIKSAGGLFALDMDLTQESGNERFFKNYNESLRFQEKLNIDMAESAAALPGVTSQYVSTSRQLTDTIQMVMEKDRESFNKMAARYGADISQGGTDAAKNAMQTILKKQTEQVVLQSQGQKGGLPMHIAIQQLMGKEAKNGKIGVQAFTNKFRAAFQKNPLLKNFLIRAEEDLAKTDAGSVERLNKIIEVFDAAMPVEVINKMRGSISGMMEAMRSGLLDPQAGLFGMSRAVFAEAGTDAQFVDESGKLLKKNVNDFGEFIFKISEDVFDKDMAKKLGVTSGENLKGQELTLKQLKKIGLDINANNQIIDAQGNIYGEISRSNTYLFEQIREILAGFGPVLLEFVGFLPMLFDPFTQMTQSLVPLRDAAQEFVAGFNNNVNAIEKEAQAYAASSDAATAGLGSVLKGQSRGRAAIGKVVKFLEQTGGISEKLAGDILGVAQDTTEGGIKNYDKAITGFIEPLFRSLIESDLAKSLSKGFGQIVGGIIRTVFDMITGVFSLAEGGAANAIVDGFQEGFGSMFEDLPMSKVTAALTGLMNMVFLKIADILIFQVIPMAAMAVIQGLTGLVLSGNPIGMILGALGLVKIAGIIFSSVSLIGGLFSTLAGIIGFVATNFALLSGIVGTVVVTILAPILAVAGAVMIVIAVVRNFGSILKMLGGIMKMSGGIIIEAVSTLVGAFGHYVEFIGNMMGPLGGMVRNMGKDIQGAGGDLKNFGKGLREDGLNDFTEAGSAMKKQFAEDTAAMRGETKKLVNGLDPATAAANNFASATNDATKAQVKSVKRYDTDTKTALLRSGVSGSQVTKMEGNRAGIDDEIAMLRAGKRKGPDGQWSDPIKPVKPVEPAKDIVTKSGDASKPLTSAIPVPAAAGMGNIPTPAPTTQITPVIPTPEQTGIAAVTNNTQEVIEPTVAMSASLNEMKAPLIELPVKMDESLMRTGMEITQAITHYGEAVCNKMQEVINAMTPDSESIKVEPGLSPLNVQGDLGGGGKGTGAHKGFFPMYKGNVYSAAGGMNLGGAIASEMKHKPAGSDLVIANSSETIIPASMSAGPGASGTGSVTVGDITVNVAGVDDPKAIANEVAEEILQAIQRSSFTELFTS